MPMEVENHVIDLLPAHALGMLTGAEADRVTEHLAGCPSCQAEYHYLRQVADELPLALAQTAPPPALKDRLMSQIHDRRMGSIVTSQPSIWQRLQSYIRLSTPAWALALIIVLALGNVIQWRQLSQVADVPTPAMRVFALASTDQSPGAIGTLIMDQAGEYGTLVVDNLAELDFDQQYQVWLIVDGQRTSAGLFSVNYDGYASLELLAPQPLIKYDAIGITVEPAGGSPGPTGERVLGGDISN
jgi:anti-sigma-K factor RskA